MNLVGKTAEQIAEEINGLEANEPPRIPGAMMPLDEARQVLAALTDAAIKKNVGLAGDAEMRRAMVAVYNESTSDPAWLGALGVLKRAGIVRAVEGQIKRDLGIGVQAVRQNRMRLVTAESVADKPIIDFGAVSDLPKLTLMAWSALKKRNSGPHLFMRAGVPVRLEINPQGRAVFMELNADRLRYEVAEAADWQEDMQDAAPPMEVVKNMLAMPDLPLPVLRRVVTVPVFAANGRLIDVRGFDEESGIYYLPAPGFHAIPIPEIITPELVNEANRLLCAELLVDFPFATNADRDNAIGLCILGFVREMILGSTPNHAVEASIRSAGKGKLARACAGIYAGDELASSVPLETEKEWKDMITSELLETSPAVLVDNIEKPLRSAALAVAWTEPFWKDRLFHKQVMARVPISCVWITTANNMLMHEDLMTRSIRIRLEPATSRPENRTGLKDLDFWCRENRAKLVWAIHVIVKWWLQKDRPGPVDLTSTRHAEWCRVMGGILHCAGYADFLKNQSDFQRSAASGAEVYAAFCEAWWFWAHREPNSDIRAERLQRATTSDLLALAQNIDDFPISDRKGGESRSLGIWLRNCRGRLIESREEINGRIVLRTYVIERHIKYVAGKQPWSITLRDEVAIEE